MRVPERLKLRVYDAVHRDVHPDAQASLREGRKLVRRGEQAAAIRAFADAARVDGRVYCRPWGLERHWGGPAHVAVREHMQRRLTDWYKGDGPKTAPPVARLADKVALRMWAETQSEVRLPKALGQHAGFADVDWANWQDASVVIKPRHGEMARGVLVLDDGFDLMRHTDIGPDLAAYAAQVWQDEGVADGPILIEELVRDPLRQQDPSVRIPRDFKGFCAHGKLAYVILQDTNGPGGYQAFRCRRSFDAMGAMLPRTHAAVKDNGSTETPENLSTVIQAMERLSDMFPQPLRFDFYLGDDGPVLGEITTYPFAGLNYAPFSARTFLQMLVASDAAGQ